MDSEAGAFGAGLGFGLAFTFFAWMFTNQAVSPKDIEYCNLACDKLGGLQYLSADIGTIECHCKDNSVVDRVKH